MAKIAFCFPGQGTQYVGMGKELYDNNEKARELFDIIFKDNAGLKSVMFEGPEETLKITKYTQPAIVAMTLVLEKLVAGKGIKADYTAGHSLGEYSALGAAGVLEMADCVKLAAKRGEIMTEVAEKADGTMAAVLGLTSDVIEKALEGIDGVIEAVNYNEPAQTVIAGTKTAIEKSVEVLKNAGAKRVLPLPVSGPFHSSLMKPAGEELKAEFGGYSFKNAGIPIIANTDASEITDAEAIKDELYRQSFGPVKWVDTIKKLKEAGVTTIYEIGPGKVLNGLIKKIDKEITVINVEKTEDIEKL